MPLEAKTFPSMPSGSGHDTEESHRLVQGLSQVLQQCEVQFGSSRQVESLELSI